jgi:hypothetical protein
MNELEYMLDDVDCMLTTLRREMEKAICIALDVTTEYFIPLQYSVDHKDSTMIRMITEKDASIAGAKAEIVNDLIQKMIDMVDDYRNKSARRESNGIDGQREARGRGFPREQQNIQCGSGRCDLGCE